MILRIEFPAALLKVDSRLMVLTKFQPRIANIVEFWASWCGISAGSTAPAQQR